MQFATPTPPTADPPQQDRLPSFLLSSSAAPHHTPSRSPGDMTASDAIATPSWPFHNPNTPIRRPVHPVAFNDRLRTDASPLSAAAAASSSIGVDPMSPSIPSPTPDLRTPSRMPPTKSLLDASTPSVIQLRTPSASAIASQPPTGSFARTTPTHASPARPGAPVASSAWITIFGFSADVESHALREFRRHGEIVRTIPGKGNWIHVLYRTPLQAQVALYKPWRVLAASDIMVGAVPCTEPELASRVDDNVERGFLLASPANPPVSAHTPTSTPRPDRPSFAHHPSPHTPGLPTPSAVLRRDQGRDPASAQSIVRTPQRQNGLFDLFSGLYR